MTEVYRLSLMRIVRCAALLCLCLRAADAHAQPGLLGDGASIERGRITPSHAWFVVHVKGDQGSILHVPPRASGPLVRQGAGDGACRGAHMLQEFPEAVAAVGDRLYVVSRPVRSTTGDVIRQVVSLRAMESAIDGLWATIPRDGRLPAHPALTGDSFIVDAAGTPEGPALLLLEVSTDRATLTPGLRVLSRDAWHALPLPEPIRGEVENTPAGRRPDWKLLSWRGGIGIAARANGRLSVHLRELSGEAPIADGPWREFRVPAEIAGEDAVILGGAEHAGVLTIALRRAEGDAVLLSRLLDGEGNGWRSIATTGQVPPEALVLPMPEDGRIVLMWLENGGEAKPDTPGAVKRRMVEYSLETGRRLFDGEARMISPITENDRRVLFIASLGVMVIALLLVLKPGDGAELSLPEGYALAEPGRRAAAGMLDLVIGMAAGSWLCGESLVDVLSLKVALTGGMLPVVGASLAVLVGLNSILEAFFGRSIGKMLMGIELIAAATSGPEAAQPMKVPFHRCFLRNLIKWCLPPVAMIGLLTATGRHRGDEFSRAAAVVRYEEEDEGTEP